MVSRPKRILRRWALASCSRARLGLLARSPLGDGGPTDSSARVTQVMTRNRSGSQGRVQDHIAIGSEAGGIDGVKAWNRLISVARCRLARRSQFAHRLAVRLDRHRLSLDGVVQGAIAPPDP